MEKQFKSEVGNEMDKRVTIGMILLFISYVILIIVVGIGIIILN